MMINFEKIYESSKLNEGRKALRPKTICYKSLEAVNNALSYLQGNEDWLDVARIIVPDLLRVKKDLEKVISEHSR